VQKREKNPVRAVSDELGLTTPKAAKRRTPPSVRRAPRRSTPKRRPA
jgi:hypothetical protein